MYSSQDRTWTGLLTSANTEHYRVQRTQHSSDTIAAKRHPRSPMVRQKGPPACHPSLYFLRQLDVVSGHLPPGSHSTTIQYTSFSSSEMAKIIFLQPFIKVLLCVIILSSNMIFAALYYMHRNILNTILQYCTIQCTKVRIKKLSFLFSDSYFTNMK